MEIKVTYDSDNIPLCENCGEELSSWDDVVYWHGNGVTNPLGYGVRKPGLYHKECYDACKEEN
jgi:hypothetical protein